MTTPLDLAYLALLVACGAEDTEVDDLMALVYGAVVPASAYLTVTHARDVIATYRMDKAEGGQQT